MIDNRKLFQTCEKLLDTPTAIKFIAEYFETTESHATWLLDAYMRYEDEIENDSSIPTRETYIYKSPGLAQ